MSVEIEPFELTFRRPFTVEVARTLTIKNSNTTPVVFKVKTTAPRQYVVRPNAGRIEPGQEFAVAVLLQAMKEDPPLDAKCRDKFLVQSAPITPEKEFSSIASVLDSSDKGLVQETKIRVSWLAPENGEPPVAGVTPSKPRTSANDITDTPDNANRFSSPGGNNDTPSIANNDNDMSSPVAPRSDSKSAVSAAASTVASTAQMTYEELKTKLAAAEAQLVNMKDQGLRQRNVKGSGSGGAGSSPAAQMAQATKQTVEGVPVHLVAGLCVFSFLLAYFFF